MFAAAASVFASAAFEPVFGVGYLQGQRDALVGSLDSGALLDADNRNGLLPPQLERDANKLQLTFVDEPSCIGCRNCAEVARATFRMEEDYGAARVFQQCGDEPDVIEEAMDCCPVDCIHLVSFNELQVLEAHRTRMLESGEMAAAQGVAKLSARAEGRDGAPGDPWRAPLRGMRFDDGGLDEPAGIGAEPDAQPAPSKRVPGQEVGLDVLAILYPEAQGDEDL